MTWWSIQSWEVCLEPAMTGPKEVPVALLLQAGIDFQSFMAATVPGALCAENQSHFLFYQQWDGSTI